MLGAIRFRAFTEVRKQDFGQKRSRGDVGVIDGGPSFLRCFRHAGNWNLASSSVASSSDSHPNLWDVRSGFRCSAHNRMAIKRDRVA